MLLKQRYKRQEYEEEGVNSFGLRYVKEKNLVLEKESIGPHCLEKLLRKTQWTCCKTDYILNTLWIDCHFQLLLMFIRSEISDLED
jgi:hypothetical protein